jgi:hypothetical protein
LLQSSICVPIVSVHTRLPTHTLTHTRERVRNARPAAPQRATQMSTPCVYPSNHAMRQ